MRPASRASRSRSSLSRSASCACRCSVMSCAAKTKPPSGSTARLSTSQRSPPETVSRQARRRSRAGVIGASRSSTGAPSGSRRHSTSPNGLPKLSSPERPVTSRISGFQMRTRPRSSTEKIAAEDDSTRSWSVCCSRRARQCPESATPRTASAGRASATAHPRSAAARPVRRPIATLPAQSSAAEPTSSAKSRRNEPGPGHCEHTRDRKAVHEREDEHGEDNGRRASSTHAVRRSERRNYEQADRRRGGELREVEEALERIAPQEELAGQDPARQGANHRERGHQQRHRDEERLLVRARLAFCAPAKPHREDRVQADENGEGE